MNIVARILLLLDIDFCNLVTKAIGQYLVFFESRLNIARQLNRINLLMLQRINRYIC